MCGPSLSWVGDTHLMLLHTFSSKKFFCSLFSSCYVDSKSSVFSNPVLFSRPVWLLFATRLDKGFRNLSMLLARLEFVSRSSLSGQKDSFDRLLLDLEWISDGIHVSHFAKLLPKIISTTLISKVFPSASLRQYIFSLSFKLLFLCFSL